MDVSNLNNIQLVRLLIYGKGETQKSMCQKINEHPVTFSQKIHKNNLKFCDVQKICEKLGYKITIQ
jgi:hypothetical protein